jgi:hypothetical protein
VRPQRERKKKLILAFHFQFANRAGWDCGSCRKHGLEVKRRCGFIPEEKRGPARVVWARKNATAEECPRSAATGASLGLVEDFFVRRRLGIRGVSKLEARSVDAFLILQNEMEREERDVAEQH